MTSLNGSATPESVPLAADDTKESGMLVAVIGMLSFFTVFGSLGNAVVLYVYRKKRNKLASTVFIITLACTDLLTCVIIIPYTMVLEKVEYVVQYDFFCKFYMFLITSNVPFSAFIMAAIAMDRYICICHPFTHLLNTKRAKMMILLLGLTAITLGIITALNFGVYYLIPVSTMRPTQQTPYSNYSTNVSITNGVLYEEAMSLNRELNMTRIDVTLKGSADNDEIIQHVLQSDGRCGPNGLIFSREFTAIYQKIYSSFFVIVLVIVLVLYIMIYRFVVLRRARRLQMRRQRSGYSSCRELEPSISQLRTSITKNGFKTELHKASFSGSQSSSFDRVERPEICRQSTIREKSIVANVRTAGMLFVVTAIFIVVFLPAWLMAHLVIPYNIIVFYMYFFYNVANPIVYAFMNKAFRRDLGDLLGCKMK